MQPLLGYCCNHLVTKQLQCGFWSIVQSLPTFKGLGKLFQRSQQFPDLVAI